MKHDLLILGSQNAKVEDQKLKRSEIRPVQILYKNGEVKPVNFFKEWGEVGVSSIAWDERFSGELFISINDEIRRFDGPNKTYSTLDLGKIGDLHDIHFIDGLLWVSNTEYDEAIAYDAKQGEVSHRISLDEFRLKLDDISDGEEYKKVKDRFHCNQVFRNYNDELCVLIHSISGWQFYRVLFEMLVKKQGDGGVINLENNEVHQLKLQSPHSVRKIKDQYWIQDSSDLSTKIFDKDWKHSATIKTGGFGRGVDFSEEENIAYIGLSSTRKRYLKVIPTSDYHVNRVFVADINLKKKITEIPVPNIEQMDNVYILDEEMRSIFESLM
ncbi:MAG: DUF4915 domain-containing protein [Balneolaceae bacterium]